MPIFMRPSGKIPAGSCRIISSHQLLCKFENSDKKGINWFYLDKQLIPAVAELNDIVIEVLAACNITEE